MAIGIVIYKPDGTFIQRLDKIYDYGYEVFLFDNSPFSTLKDSNNTNYFHNSSNPGLSHAMKTISQSAYNNGYSSILYFDQDTLFTRETLDYMNKIKNSFISSSENKYSAISISDRKNLDNSVIKVDLIRNSGTLFFLENLKKIGWFDETYFVDGVDYEFCLRSKIHNYMIGAIETVPGFDHEEDQGYKNYSFFGISKIGRRYNNDRIKDIFISSLRISFQALVHLKIKFSIKIIALLILFMINQLIFRIANR
jgi:rhamnosyltransferase